MGSMVAENTFTLPPGKPTFESAAELITNGTVLPCRADLFSGFRQATIVSSVKPRILGELKAAVVFARASVAHADK
jgi:hypothetical protein